MMHLESIVLNEVDQRVTEIQNDLPHIYNIKKHSKEISKGT